MSNFPSAPPAKILIVEDDVLVARDVQERLVSQGLDVLGTARSAAAALMVAAQQPPDVVLMDLHLCGDMDGAEAAAHLRTHFDIPCIFLTAHRDAATIARCKASSPLGYIVKPYSDEDFDLTIALGLQQLALIREREAAYRARDIANARYAHVLLHSVDAVIRFDSDLCILEYNRGAQRAFGWREGEAVGRSMTELLPNESSSAPGELLRVWAGIDAEQDRLGTRRRVVARRTDGTEFPCEVLVSRDPVGDDNGYTALVRDLSEEERLRSQFIQAQKLEAVGLLGANVAHDFNNLLLGLRAYMFLLRKEATETQRQYLDECERALNQGASLTQNLTTLAKPNSPDEQVFSVAAAVSETVKFAAELLPRRIDLDYQEAELEQFVRMNRDRFNQALLNLMINARDAIEGQGTITVDSKLAVHDGRQWIELQVTDAGCGMSPVVAQQAFTPFYSTKPPGLGTGLGLPSVRNIVESAGGKVSLTSTEGVGTSVTLALPSVPAPAAAEKTAPSVPC